MKELRFDTKGLTVPTSWEDLVALSDFLSIYGGATRTVDDQKRYDNYIDSTPRDVVLENIKNQLVGREAALLKNNYPYSRVLQDLPQVGHYLIWSKKGELQKEEIHEIIEKEYPGKEWFTFVTAEGSKSIPEIWHAHVMIRQR